MNKEIKTNVVINLIRTITMTLLSFITFPVVCRILGDSMLGHFSWATSFVYYFIVLSKISIPNIAIRECAKVKDDPNKLSIKVQEFFIMQAVMTLLSFGLLTLIVFSVPAFNGELNQTLIFILSLNFLTSIFAFEWVFTALEKQTYLAIRSIIILGVVDVLIFVFVKRPDDVYTYTFITTLTTILTVISNIFYLPKLVKFRKTEKYNFKQYLPSLLILFCISLCAAIYSKTDSFILGLIDTSKKSVGSYSVGMKGVDIIISFFISLSSVFMPKASQYYNLNDNNNFLKINKYSTNICLLIAVPAIALMSTLATPITSLISGSYDSSSYNDASTILIALTLLMVTYSLSNNIYTQILIPQKREKVYLYSMIIGSVFNIGLSLLFGIVILKDRPAVGVAIATSMSDLIIFIFLLSFTWKTSNKMLFNINNLKILILGIILGLVSYFVGPLLFDAFSQTNSIQISYIFEILCIVGISIIIYIVGLIVSKEKITSNIFFKKEY